MKDIKIANEKLFEQAYNNPFKTIEEERPTHKISVYYSEHREEFECTISSIALCATLVIYSESEKKYLDKICELADSFSNELDK